MDIKELAKQRLKIIEQSPSEAYIIHYSCESFADKPDGYSPRISSIAIKDFESAQTHSFSIHNMAEIKHISRDGIEQHYDVLERDMLDEFYSFLARSKSITKVDPFVKTQSGSKLKESFPFRLSESGVAAVVVVVVGDVVSQGETSKPCTWVVHIIHNPPWFSVRDAQLKYTCAGVR